MVETKLQGMAGTDGFPDDGIESKPPASILKKSSIALDGSDLPPSRTAKFMGAEEEDDEEAAERLKAKRTQTKFDTLSDGVLNSLALFHTCLEELLLFKDELIQHALPPNLLVKFSLVCARMFRSASDLNVPINELIRLVRLFSVPWDEKSAALKKLHEDYDSKQRQLNIALKKLEMVGIHSERMAKERRVLNWERLFSKVMSSKGHGHRWKFLIESFKQKLQSGEIYFENHSELGSDNEDADQDVPAYDTAVGAVKTKLSRATADSDEEEGESSGSEALSELDDNFHDTISTKSKDTRTRKSDAEDDGHENVSFKSSMQDEGGSDDQSRPGEARPRKGIGQRPRFGQSGRKRSSADSSKKTRVRFGFGDSDSDDDDESYFDGSVNVPSVTVTDAYDKQPTADQSCWTHEPDYDRFLHVRVYKPFCTQADPPHVTISLRDQIFKSGSYETPPSTPDPSASQRSPASSAKSRRVEEKKPAVKSKSLSSQADGKKNESRMTSAISSVSSLDTDVPRFEEFVFQLPDENAFGGDKTDFKEEQIKLAVHPGPTAPMIAMATIKIKDLKILDHYEGRWSHTEQIPPTKYPLVSVVSTTELSFNSECGHVSLLCYESKQERHRQVSKATETITADELADEIILERRRIEEEMKTEEDRRLEEEQARMQYTEDHIQHLMQQHAEEMQAIQQDYEKRIAELAEGFGVMLVPPGERGDDPRSYISAATSPIPQKTADGSHAPRPPSEGRAQTVPRRRPRVGQTLPDWGKDLPLDFLERMALFQSASMKHKQELVDKTKKAIQDAIEQQLVSQNRLDAAGRNNIDYKDVSLPALFMPTRTGHVYSAKANKYFHPVGSGERRFTQPPSMFKLPVLAQKHNMPLAELFEFTKNFRQQGAREAPEERPESPEELTQMEYINLLHEHRLKSA